MAVDRARWPAASNPPERPSPQLGAVGVAVFIALGRQLPGIAGIIGDPKSNEAYADNPTAFWLVALSDLGVVTPAASCAATGLRRGLSWARTAAYAVIGWFSLVPMSVAAMNITMRINNDPLVTSRCREGVPPKPSGSTLSKAMTGRVRA